MLGADADVRPRSLGEDRPSTGNVGMGRAELGVVDDEIESREADRRLVDDPDMGV